MTSKLQRNKQKTYSIQRIEILISIVHFKNWFQDFDKHDPLGQVFIMTYEVRNSSASR